MMSRTRPAPRRPFAFRQSDLTKAVKAAAAAGLHVAGYKINARGEIEVLIRDAENKTAENPPVANEWDEGLRRDKSST
jgi:hypothetical protein